MVYVFRHQPENPEPLFLKVNEHIRRLNDKNKVYLRGSRQEHLDRTYDNWII